jgi:hypothetical protein
VSTARHFDPANWNIAALWTDIASIAAWNSGRSINLKISQTQPLLEQRSIAIILAAIPGRL